MDDLARFQCELTSPVWRVASSRRQPFIAPPAELQGQGRFDDPEGKEFSVLYGAAHPTGALLEILQRFRLDLGTAADLERASVVDVVDRDDFRKSHPFDKGLIPKSWAADARLSAARLELQAPLFDLSSASALQWLRHELAILLVSLGVDDLDFGEVLSTNRNLTRGISNWVRGSMNMDGSPAFAGIRFRSRFDPDELCYALYADRFRVQEQVDSQPLLGVGNDLMVVTSLFSLQIEQ